ncbi:MAG TPA: hypothetical protein VLX11_09275 [Candidatus Acidoferrales bacterium]|nr:hypothetical protein [Candidatus Acidoferrales bacterium]
MAKKKSHEADIQKGLEELRQLGIAPDDGAAFLNRIKQEIGKSRARDLAIAFTLGKVAQRASVEMLIEIEKHSSDKDLKKEVRRSLFKLGQKGLNIAREESSNPMATVGFNRPPEIEAYMSAVDGAGGRLVWIVKPQPNFGLQTIQAMVNDRDGLQRIGGAQIRRKELRQMAQEIKRQHGITMISVPWEYADQMIYASFERAKSQGRTGLENFHELRSMIASGKPKPQDHPIYGKLDEHLVREGAWRELSRRMLDEQELRFWVLDEEFTQPFLAQLQEAQTSRLVLNPMQKEERLASIVRDAVAALCTGEMGKWMQHRMEDLALYFFETERPDHAKLALAVALQIKEGNPGPLDVSFLTGLVQKSFAVYLAQQKTKSEEEPSLIVKP